MLEETFLPPHHRVNLQCVSAHEAGHIAFLILNNIPINYIDLDLLGGRFGVSWVLSQKDVVTVCAAGLAANLHHISTGSPVYREDRAMAGADGDLFRLSALLDGEGQPVSSSTRDLFDAEVQRLLELLKDNAEMQIYINRWRYRIKDWMLEGRTRVSADEIYAASQEIGPPPSINVD